MSPKTERSASVISFAEARQKRGLEEEPPVYLSGNDEAHDYGAHFRALQREERRKRLQPKE